MVSFAYFALAAICFLARPLIMHEPEAPSYTIDYSEQRDGVKGR